MPAVKKWRTGRDTILFVGYMPEGVADDLKAYGDSIDTKLKSAVIFDQKVPIYGKKAKARGADIIIPTDFTSVSKVQKALLPIRDQLLSVTTRSDWSIPLLRKVIPHIPELRTSSLDSLLWSTDKVEMRKRFFAYDKSITPKFAIAKDSTQATIARIDKRVGFPCVVKPPSLAESILVSICFHEEELQTALRKTFSKVRSVYKKKKILDPPRVLVEEFMDGNMYSIDAYVSSRGTCTFTPMVYIKTGRSIGFDDFFGYLQISPPNLKVTSIKEAEKVATKAIAALGLTSTSAHVELMRTEHGWKVIEVGPRTGGFRAEMYQLSFGFSHALNDVLVRIPNKLRISKRRKGYTAAMKFFARQEGELIKLAGLKKAQGLASFHKINIRHKVGDYLLFAKHGGKSVFNIILFNKDRSKLLADIRRLEKMVKIETKKVSRRKTTAK
ncbi:MAG TPA: ATP-grasp domain-containing protein [Patescibacteria group bacterium]|nr:ATP-grasp domain-containing protein [Patescibacteria group bacterium]